MRSLIEELEKEGDVFVTRTLKDGQMKMVYWNEVKAEKGAEVAPPRDGSNGTGLSVEKGAPIICVSQARGSTASVRVPRSLAFAESTQRGRSAKISRKR